jgi:hypothetical protein
MVAVIWRGARTAFWYVAHMALAVVLMLAGGYAGIEIAAALTTTDVHPRGDDPNWFGGLLIGGVVGFFGTGLLLAGVYTWLDRRQRAVR